MKQLFTLLICSIVGGLSAQSADWNPDANGDGLVGSSDLLALLTAYGESFAPPLEDDAWVECTEEHFTVISDTIYPSELQGPCTGLEQDHYSYNLFLASETELSYWMYLDSMLIASAPLVGSVAHVVTLPNTCNSVNLSTIHEMVGIELVNSTRWDILATPPDYAENARFRTLNHWNQGIPSFITEIGSDIDHGAALGNDCDFIITRTIIPNSFGSLRIGPNLDETVLYENAGVLENGVWIWR